MKALYMLYQIYMNIAVKIYDMDNLCNALSVSNVWGEFDVDLHYNTEDINILLTCTIEVWILF